MDKARAFGRLDEDVVQREVMARAADRAVEHGPVLEEKPPRSSSRKCARASSAENVVRAEAPPVDPDDRHLGAGGLAGDPEKGAVAADHAAGVAAPEIPAREGQPRGILHRTPADRASL